MFTCLCTLLVSWYRTESCRNPLCVYTTCNNTPDDFRMGMLYFFIYYATQSRDTETFTYTQHKHYSLTLYTFRHSSSTSKYFQCLYQCNWLTDCFYLFLSHLRNTTATLSTRCFCIQTGITVLDAIHHGWMDGWIDRVSHTPSQALWAITWINHNEPNNWNNTYEEWIQKYIDQSIISSFQFLVSCTKREKKEEILEGHTYIIVLYSKTMY